MEQQRPHGPWCLQGAPLQKGSKEETFAALAVTYGFTKEVADLFLKRTMENLEDFCVLVQDDKATQKDKSEDIKTGQSDKERLQKTQDIETASQELTTTSATLLDDMEYLDELNTICSNKAISWDKQRMSSLPSRRLLESSRRQSAKRLLLGLPILRRPGA